EVEQHGVGQAIDRQQPIDLGEIGQRALGSLVARKLRGPLEHLGVAEQRGQRQQGVAHGRGRHDLIDQALQGGPVLAGERGPELSFAGSVGLDLLHQAAEEIGMADVELEATEAERAQALHGHGQDLDLGLRLVEADQLHAGLVELAAVGELRLVVAEDVGHVGQPQRLRLVAQAGGHDARDLGRDVGAQHEHAARFAVHEGEGVALHGLVGGDGQHVEELERRRDDLAIAPAAEDVEQARLHVTLARDLVGKVDPRTLGKLGEERLHPPGSAQRWASVVMRCTVTQSSRYSSSVMPAGEASMDHRRAGPSPSPSRTISRITTAWVTSTTLSPSWSARSVSMPSATRLATVGKDSPPRAVNLSGAVRQTSWRAGSAASTSARVRPSHAPKPSSRKAGMICTARRCGLATASAEMRARSSGLAKTAEMATPLSAAAAASLWRRPASVSGTSRHPAKRRSRVNTVSP